MATVTLGNIKLNWKGAYNAGTAYAIDDVVSYNGSSYIAKTATTGNLPTVTANWDLMSQAGTNGTNGTDLTTTLTTQGDILYRDGSGLQRLAAGTSGQVLQTGGSGANPSWTDAGGGHLLAFYEDSDYSNHTTTSTSEGLHGSNISISLTPASTASKFYLLLTFQGGNNMAARRSIYKFYQDGNALNYSQMEHELLDGYSNENPSAMSMYVHPNTTSQITFDVRFRANGASDTAKLNMQRLAIFEFAS